MQDDSLAQLQKFCRNRDNRRIGRVRNDGGRMRIGGGLSRTGEQIVRAVVVAVPADPFGADALRYQAACDAPKAIA